MSTASESARFRSDFAGGSGKSFLYVMRKEIMHQLMDIWLQIGAILRRQVKVD